MPPSSPAMTVCGLVGSIQTAWTSPCAPLETADYGKAFARVLAQDERAVGFEDAIRILRIDDQVRKVKRPPDHPGALVAFVPRQPAIIGDKERAVGGFDKSVNTFRIGRRDRDCDAAVRLLRKTFAVLGSKLSPRRATISRAKQSAAGRLVRTITAGAERPSFATKIPQAREHLVRISRIERDGRGAGGKVRALQHEVPIFAPVRRFVETAIGRIAPERAGHGRVNGVAVFRADDNLRHALRIGQARAGPRFTAVHGFVNSVAHRNAVARPRFARSDPNVLRIFRVERDRANRLHRLLVEHRLVARPAILGFPNAAAGRADEDGDFPGRLLVGGDGGDASAHGSGANVACAKTGDGGGAVRCLLGGASDAGQR